jgi:hypothetical protein
VTGRTNYTLLCKAYFNKFIQRIRRLQRNHAFCCKMKKKYKILNFYPIVRLEWTIIFLKILTECRVSMPFRTKLSHYSMEYDSIFNVVYLHRKLLLVLGRSSGSTSCALSAGPPHQTSERGGACSGTGSPRFLSSSLGFAECPEGGSTV